MYHLSNNGNFQMLTRAKSKNGNFYSVIPNRVGLVNVWILNLNHENQFAKCGLFNEVTKNKFFPLKLSS